MNKREKAEIQTQLRASVRIAANAAPADNQDPYDLDALTTQLMWLAKANAYAIALREGATNEADRAYWLREMQAFWRDAQEVKDKIKRSAERVRIHV